MKKQDNQDCEITVTACRGTAGIPAASTARGATGEVAAGERARAAPLASVAGLGGKAAPLRGVRHQVVRLPVHERRVRRLGLPAPPRRGPRE